MVGVCHEKSVGHIRQRSGADLKSKLLTTSVKITCSVDLDSGAGEVIRFYQLANKVSDRSWTHCQCLNRGRNIALEPNVLTASIYPQHIR